MNSRHKQGQDSQGRPGRLGSLVGLLAFLPYMLLPLVYYVHLTATSLPAASGDLQTGSPIIDSETGEPASPHESNNCPICRGSSSFQDNGTSPSFIAPDSSSLAGRLADGSSFSGFARADVVTSHTRAPPGVPLAQATA